MPDAPGRPRETRVDEAVRDAVHALLATEGYPGTTIAAVAARAGVGRGALYRRWRSKAELVFANVIHATELAEPDDSGTLSGDLEALSLHIAELSGSAAARAALAGLAADPSSAARWTSGCSPPSAATWPASSRFSTETRVQPTDERAARKFRPYWLAIRAGSGLIRRDILRAVRRLAERSS